jgi:DNA-binding response OmpR family regulator
MTEQLRKGLEREGYSVLLAHDGQQALDYACTIDHDLNDPRLDAAEDRRAPGERP